MNQGLRPGTILRDTYRIEQMLGQGGFGITYLAIDITLDRKVAIKEFFPKDYCDRQADTSHVTLGTQNTAHFVNRLKAKFLKEAKNIAKFDNPGIIKIHAAFEANNTAYYVMDYIEGESLSEIVKRDGPIPEERALKYIEQVGRALEYVHAHRMNHLDVKPANIMVRQRDDLPILIDFGLSKQYDSEGNQTSTTPTGISHGYAPMEQYNDGGVQEFSPQTDLYSLAATLYYILSGIVPPQATRLIDEEITFPPSIPNRFILPITKAMSSSRRARHQTIAEFIKDIKETKSSEYTELPLAPRQQADPKKQTENKISEFSQKNKSQATTGTNNKKTISLIAISLLGVVAIIMIIMAVTKHASSDQPLPDTDSITVIDIPIESITVSDMAYESAFGPCSYTGEIDENGKPHGKGKAIWSKSKFAKVYNGKWVHGKMEGECEYELLDGSIFKGDFKDNHFDSGRLTNPDGSYYEGTFDDKGYQYNGIEYDKNGKAIDKWVDGE